MGSRRETLGAVQNIPRASTVFKPRQSLAVGSDGRISSGKPSQPRSRSSEKKTRVRTHPDLGDKGYLREAKQNIITFLVENRYFHHNDDGVSPQKLANITQKEFFSYCRFLLAHFDPGIPTELLPGAEACELVSTYLRRLKYPYHFTTSYMQAVGSQVYAPHVFAMMDWLVAQARYLLLRTEHAAGDEKKPADNSVFGPQQARQRMRVFERGYAAWMSGEDDEVDEDDCVLNRLLREQHAESRREGEAMDQRMQQEVEEMQATIQQQQDASDDVMQIMAEVKQQQSAEEELVKGNRLNQDMIRDMERSEVELDAHAQQQDQILAEMQVELSRLEAQVARQPLQKEEIAQIEAQRALQQENKVEQENQCAKAAAMCLKNEKELNQAFSKLSSVVFKNNEQLMDQELVPSTSRRAKGINYALAVNKEGQSPEEIMGTDIAAVIAPGLRAVHDSDVERQAHAALHHGFLQERCECALRTIAETEVDAQPVVEAHRAILAAAATEQAAFETQMLELTSTIAGLKVHNQSLLEEAEGEERAAMEALKAQKQLVKSEGRAWCEEFKQLLQRVGDRVGLLLDHKQRMSEMVVAIKEGVDLEADAVEALHAEIGGVMAQLGLPV